MVSLNDPEAGVHVLTRAWHDRRLADGGLLSEAAQARPLTAPRVVALRETATRKARDANLSLRFAEVAIQRPKTPDAKGLAKTVALTLVEVIETEPPTGAEPVLWRLLTTHAVADETAAWQIVDWYRRRWAIEQLFRLMKTDGLRLEDSQLADAASLVKLAIIATKASATNRQASPSTTASKSCSPISMPAVAPGPPSNATRTDQARSPGPATSSPASADGMATRRRDHPVP